MTDLGLSDKAKTTEKRLAARSIVSYQPFLRIKKCVECDCLKA